MKRAETNRLWGREIVQALLKAGVKKCFICPGARSVALVSALAELPGKVVLAHFDERGASFAALGWIKATGEPAACFTTSGSAVVNLHPAVIEASYSNLPLVIVTADRPPELRGTGANQTIFQSGIFGSAVRWAADFPCPERNLMGYAVALVRDAVSKALGPHPGPVHLNLPFREPLLDTDSSRRSLPPKIIASAVEVDASKEIPPPDYPVPEAFFSSIRGVIVVGELPLWRQDNFKPILRLSAKLGWPIFADPLSGLKGEGSPVISHADFLLHHAQAPAPEKVLHLGGKLVSKRIATFLSGIKRASYVQVREGAGILDPFEQLPIWISGDPFPFCQSIAKGIEPQKNSKWLQQWTRAEAQADSLLSRHLDQKSECSESSLCRLAARLAQQSDADMYLGNSMPIRDFDGFVGLAAAGVRVAGNRGASGIDGNIATMAGMALGSGRKVIGLLGDLAALHDLNSLALLDGLPVTLFVVNNQGGGIFHFLSMGMASKDREKWVETPHGFQFEHAAKQFGIDYLRSNSVQEIRSVARKPRKKPILIEVPSNREKNYRQHVRLAMLMQKISDPWNLS